MIALYVSCPLGLVMRCLPSSALKHLFSFATGLLLVQWVFASTWIHPMVASLVTYLVCYFGPKKHNHKIVMLFQLGYLFLCHLYYQYAYYMSSMLAFTGTQMVLVMKLSAFAYNVHDGRVFAKAKADGKALSKSDELLSKLAVSKFPSLLEFLGYAFCFTSILAGPSFEYQVSQRLDNATSIDLHDSCRCLRSTSAPLTGPEWRTSLRRAKSSRGPAS